MPYRPLRPIEQIGAKIPGRGGNPQKYFLDDRGRKLIMDLYDGSKERTDLLQRHLHGVPRRVIQRWACEMGKVHSRNYWSLAQESFLRDNYNKLSMRKLQEELHKEYTSILKKLDEMGLCREDPGNGYTLDGLCTALGVSENTIKRWISNEWLKGRKVTTAFNHDVWQFTDKNVRDFIVSHPGEIDPRRFDWLWVADILAGENGIGALGQQRKGEKE